MKYNTAVWIRNFHFCWRLEKNIKTKKITKIEPRFFDIPLSNLNIPNRKNFRQNYRGYKGRNTYNVSLGLSFTLLQGFFFPNPIASRNSAHVLEIKKYRFEVRKIKVRSIHLLDRMYLSHLKVSTRNIIFCLAWAWTPDTVSIENYINTSTRRSTKHKKGVYSIIFYEIQKKYRLFLC